MRIIEAAHCTSVELWSGCHVKNDDNNNDDDDNDDDDDDNDDDVTTSVRAVASVSCRALVRAVIRSSLFPQFYSSVAKKEC